MLHFEPVLVPRCLLSFLLARVAVGEKEADSYSCSIVDEWFLQNAAAHSLHHRVFLSSKTLSQWLVTLLGAICKHLGSSSKHAFKFEKITTLKQK